METIDCTPTWEEILPAWQAIVSDATKVLKPEQMDRFWSQMLVMAKAADQWNEHCKFMNSQADEDEQQRANEELAPCERCNGSGTIIEPRGIAGEAFDADFCEVPCPECSE